jgi:solute carrier family 25 (mitochondrial carrier protein), member 16
MFEPGDKLANDMLRHAAGEVETNQPSEMTPAARSSPAANPPGICPSDSEQIVPLGAAEGPRKIPRQSLEYAVRSGVAGGLAACAAKTVVAPLDRVKILFQASNPQFQKYTGSWSGAIRAIRDIYRADGGRGLFRGHSATLLRIFPYGGIKFLAYEQVRAIVIPSKEYETPFRRFMAGSLAGCMSVFATYPLEVIRVRLAWETKSTRRMTFRDICRKIYNERPPQATTRAATLQEANVPRAAAVTVEATSAAVTAITPSHGISNFFRGFTPTLWGMIPYAGASFLTHDAAGDLMRSPSLAPYTVLPMSERSQKQLAPNKPAPLRAWAELTTGALAGFVSQTLSYPLEVIRRRMQVGGVVGDGHRLTMVEVGKNILRERGWKGFYVGLSIGYVKVVPMVATSFYVYERLKVFFGI